MIRPGIPRLFRLALRRHDRTVAALEEEVRLHLEQRVERLVREGWSPEEASAEARRRFGSVSELRRAAQARERRARLHEASDAIVGDVRIAVRSLRKSPGFAAVAILTLALGIGATTAIFSVVDGVLLSPLPYPHADRIVQLWEVGRRGAQMTVAEANFDDLREQSRSFEAMARYQRRLVSVLGGDQPVLTSAARISRDFLRILDVRPVLGRAFAPDERRVGGRPTVLVSHAYWRQHLGADPDLSRHTLTFRNRVYSVIGVMPPGFDFPAETDLWIPAELDAPNPYRTAHGWRVIGRLREGTTPAAAHQELTAIARRLHRQYGHDTNMFDAAVVPLREQIVGQVRPALLVLLGAAAFLLLIALVNVANLLLARAAARQRELAVRMALGAGWPRLLEQFLVESLVLSLAGGMLGVMLARWSVTLLITIAPTSLPRLDDVQVDWVVLVFALGVSVLTAVVLGVGTALRAMSSETRGALADRRRTRAGSGDAGRRVRGALMAAQIAFTLLLLIGAGLLTRSFLRLLAVDPGFRTSGAVTMALLQASPESAADEAQLARLHQELARRLRTIPGVTQVGAVSSFPLSGSGVNGTFWILDNSDAMAGIRSAEQLKRDPALHERYRRIMRDPTRAGHAEFRIADAGYFRAMGIPLVRGRLFDERDTPDGPHVAVISESLAKTRWPDADPIGELIEYGNMDGDVTPFRIVGIVGDVHDRGLGTAPDPTFYGYALQRPDATHRFTYVLRSDADPARVIAAARRIVRNLAPDVPPRFRTLDEIFSATFAPRRFSLLLLGVFGCTALLLALMGIYGVVSYWVSQRTQEIGVRMALGAPAGSVLRFVLRQSAVLTLIGIGTGLAIAVPATRVLQSQLYGISATDPLTFAGVVVLLVAVALLASYLPARKAARVDPMEALRTE